MFLKPLGAAAQGVRSVQMPFGIRQQVEQIRTYAATAAAEARGSQAKELVVLMNRSADDLEITARLMFNALGPDSTDLSPPACTPNPPDKS
jgi:hypothetical protein